MKYSTKFIKYKGLFVMVMTIIVITWSCTDNYKTSNEIDKDSLNRMEKAMNDTSNNIDEHNMMMTDSAITMSDISKMDESFMIRAAEINMEEIKLGNLAQQKGTAYHVKELGNMMVKEHTLALAELTSMAKSKMVNLPASENDKIVEAYKTLDRKNGKEFDKTYSNMMVKGHKDAITLFENTNNETKNEAVKAMTAKMIPVLKLHLEQSLACQKECAKSN